jgi:hypothetical protein
MHLRDRPNDDEAKYVVHESFAILKVSTPSPIIKVATYFRASLLIQRIALLLSVGVLFTHKRLIIFQIILLIDLPTEQIANQLCEAQTFPRNEWELR